MITEPCMVVEIATISDMLLKPYNSHVFQKRLCEIGSSVYTEASFNSPLTGDTIMIWAAIILFFAYHTLPPLFHAYFWSITGLAILGLTFEFLGTPVWFYGFFFDVVKFITFSNT